MSRRKGRLICTEGIAVVSQELVAILGRAFVMGLVRK